MFGSGGDTPAPKANVPGTGKLHARFVTSAGAIECVLHEKEAPRTVDNFVALATGTAFKREVLRPDGGRRATQLTAALRTEAHRRVGATSGARLDVDGALRLSNEPVVPFYDLDAVGGRAGVKASGGIRSLSDALSMLDAGADRLGLSATAAILAEFD